MLITLEEAAARTGRSLSTVRRWIARGNLHVWRRLGRALVEDADIDRLRAPKSDPSESTEERRPGQEAASAELEAGDDSANPTK